jgi:hypothetical protein
MRAACLLSRGRRLCRPRGTWCRAQSRSTSAGSARTTSSRAWGVWVAGGPAAADPGVEGDLGHAQVGGQVAEPPLVWGQRWAVMGGRVAGAVRVSRRPSAPACSRPGEATAFALANAQILRDARVPQWGPAINGPFSPLKRSELFREASHGVEVQEGPPTHAGHPYCGQLGERRRLRQVYDVHRAADCRREAAKRVRLP